MQTILLTILICLVSPTTLNAFVFSFIKNCQVSTVEPADIKWSGDSKFTEERVVFLAAGDNWGRSDPVHAAVKQKFQQAKIDTGKSFNGFSNVGQIFIDRVYERFQNTIMSSSTPHLNYHPKKIYHTEPDFPFRFKLRRFANMEEIASKSAEGEKPIVFDLTDFKLDSREGFLKDQEFYVDEAYMLIYLLNSPNLLNKTRFIYEGKELNSADSQELLSPLSPKNFDITDPKAWLLPSESLYQEFEALDQEDS